jgi:hypothetical protein
MLHPQMCGQTQCQRDYGQSRISLARGRKGGGADNVPVISFVHTAISIDDAETRVRAHTRRTEMMPSIPPVACHLGFDTGRIVLETAYLRAPEVLGKQGCFCRLSVQAPHDRAGVEHWATLVDATTKWRNLAEPLQS